jgi:uncharacterized membrane protein
MTFLLLVGLVILAVVLGDTRSRLRRVENQLREANRIGARPHVETTARIVPDIVEDRPDVAPIEPVLPPSEEAPEPQPVMADAAPPMPAIEQENAPERTLGFEDLFGRKLPIWAGGITLAVAGVLLVKYSIDAGLLSPAVRVVLGLLFGAGLIGGAEAILRAQIHVRDERVHQALAGAGIASLYASVLAASSLYHLVSPTVAFGGLAAITGLAMALSLRFGMPSALLGLAGGLASPALVSAGPANVPLLCGYLALAMGGFVVLSRRQRWMWLGVAALVGGAGWTLVLILSGGLDFAASLSTGLLVMLLGLGLPLLAFTEGPRSILQTAAALVAAAQIAAMVAMGGFAPLQWGLYILLSAALLWLSGRDGQLRPMMGVGLAIGLLLTFLWPAPSVLHLTLVLAALGAIYGGAALVRLWRAGGTMLEAWQIVGFALASEAVALFHFREPGGSNDVQFALLALALACLPALAAALGWRSVARRDDARFATLSVTAATLLALAAYLGLALWGLPIVLAVLASGLMLLAGLSGDRRIEFGAFAFIGVAGLSLLFERTGFDQLERLSGVAGRIDMARAFIRWASVALGAGFIALRASRPLAGSIVQAGAALAAYGALAQVVPVDWLALLAAIGLLAVAETGRTLPQRNFIPAVGMLALITGLWMAMPAARWAVYALLSLYGAPMLASDLPPWGDAVRLILLPALMLGVALLRGRPKLSPQLFWPAALFPAIAAAIGGHILFKQVFHLSSGQDVMVHGLAERTLWEALLLGIACALWQRRVDRKAVLAVAGAATLHALWYSVILFNPLVKTVAVGPWPVANLLIPSFGIAFAGLWLIQRVGDGLPASTARLLDGIRMILIVLFAFASLRQFFSGSILVTDHIGPVENIGWSVLAIALAIGFLLWGIRRRLRDWRIGSLLLMLCAVAKVFLFDVSGLEGLLRIASFVALGFSLIGLGWLYSRFLQADED